MEVLKIPPENELARRKDSSQRDISKPRSDQGVITVSDTNGNPIRFYTTMDAYLGAQIAHMTGSNVGETDPSKQEDYSMKRFIPDGHAPIYNGPGLTYRNGSGSIYTLLFHQLREGKKESVVVGQVTKGTLDFLIDEQHILITKEK